MSNVFRCHCMLIMLLATFEGKRGEELHTQREGGRGR